MALFQFTALDAAGAEKRGTIEAVTPQDAFVAIQRYGMTPTNVFPAGQLAADFSRTPVPIHRPPRPPGRGLAVASLLLSLAALLVAGAALGWQWLGGKPASSEAKPAADPLGKGLGAYDFTTPKNAFKSGLEIDKARDLRAITDLDKVRRGPEVEEKLRTFQVRKEETWKGAVILFIEFEEKGVKKHVAQGFERDARSGLWLPKYVSSYTVQSENATLANQMKNWETKGQLN
jgi:hypothetical protein